MNKSGSNVSNLIKFFESKSEAETTTSQTKINTLDDNEHRSGTSDHTDNESLS